jgi:hypothetical protein
LSDVSFCIQMVMCVFFLSFSWSNVFLNILLSYINCTKRFHCDISIHAYHGFHPLYCSCPPPRF